jgi:hypothetical protein
MEQASETASTKAAQTPRIVKPPRVLGPFFSLIFFLPALAPTAYCRSGTVPDLFCKPRNFRLETLIAPSRYNRHFMAQKWPRRGFKKF